MTVKIEPTAGVGYHKAQFYAGRRIGETDIVLYKLCTGGKPCNGDPAYLRPFYFQFGNQAIKRGKRAGSSLVVQTAFDPGTATPQRVPGLRLWNAGRMAACGLSITDREQRGDQQRLAGFACKLSRFYRGGQGFPRISGMSVQHD
ncbi:hypothetical protein D3C76_989200 [compost metagenome]